MFSRELNSLESTINEPKKRLTWRLCIKYIFINSAPYPLEYKLSNDACNINSQCQGKVVGIALRHPFTSYDPIFNNYLN